MPLPALLRRPVSAVLDRAVVHRQRLEFLRAVRARGVELQGATDHELRDRCDDLRSLVIGRRDSAGAKLRERLFALVVEALRRTIGISLYDVQLIAGEVLSSGCVAEMQTGEGKTFAIALPACWYALHGEGVHVVTSNAYLAGRDCELLRPALQCLGLSVGLLVERASVVEKRRAYECDITYGAGYEFGFDFLRDQLTRSAPATDPLGTGYLRRLRGESASQPETMQRGLACAIIDEVDNVLLDDACSPLVIAGPTTAAAPDAAAHQLAWRLSEQLAIDQHYRLSADQSRTSLTEAGVERVHAADIDVPLAVLERPWSEYVRQALQARYVLRRDVHYVVRGDEVQIVDGSTGRIFADRTWQDGLHQAIEAKESLPIHAERRPLAGITRQRFYKLYRRRCGLTGTAAGAEREFRDVYGLPVVAIPLHKPSQLRELPSRAFATQAAAGEAACDRVAELTSQGRPVLIGTQSIRASEALAARLSERGLPQQLLNGRQDADEAALIAAAGQPGCVTIATNIAGRGTDIKLAPRAAAAGGLHVIALGRHRARRIDRQLIGRCARQGAPGSAECLISAEDALLLEHAPWLTERLSRRSAANGAIASDVTPSVDRLQRRVERRDAAVRRRLLDLDLNRESILAKLE